MRCTRGSSPASGVYFWFSDHAQLFFHCRRTCALRYVCLTSRVVVIIERFFCDSLFNTFSIMSKCKSVTEMESDVSDSGLPSQISEGLLFIVIS